MSLRRSTRSARMALALMIGVTTLMGAVPAAAVSNGVPDDDHPNVACILGQRPDGSFVGCGTGQLIAPDVVLLAAHEFPVLEGLGATSFFASFDPIVDLENPDVYAAAAVVSSPGFNPVSFQGQDLAVMLLDEPVAGVTPIDLPAVGLLDELRVGGALKTEPFVVVGYGLDCTGLSAAQCVPSFDSTRRFATEQVISLRPERFMVLGNNDATGFGGPCFGDSGSPHFLGDSNVSVGVTSNISGGCVNAVAVTRLDTPSARAFLGQFVDMP